VLPIEKNAAKIIIGAIATKSKAKAYPNDVRAAGAGTPSLELIKNTYTSVPILAGKRSEQRFLTKTTKNIESLDVEYPEIDKSRRYLQVPHILIDKENKMNITTQRLSA